MIVILNMSVKSQCTDLKAASADIQAAKKGATCLSRCSCPFCEKRSSTSGEQ